MTLRTCSKGHQYAIERYSNGRTKQCPKCRQLYEENRNREYAVERAIKNACWSAANPERVKELATRWKTANPERVKELAKRWREENREKERERLKRWREENREKGREAAALWKAANPEKVREYQRKSDARRRAKKKAEKALSTPGLKTCRSGRHQYVPSSSKRGGCPECAQLYRESYALKHPEKFKAATAKWLAENPEKLRENNRRWKAENPEKVREAKKRWKAENPDKVRAQRERHRAKAALKTQDCE